jgi:hypothetical protein
MLVKPRQSMVIINEFLGDLVWINVDSTGCGNKNDLLEVDV